MPASGLAGIADRRETARKLYEATPVPTWRRSGFWSTNLRELRLDDLTVRTAEQLDERAQLPDLVRAAIGEEQEFGGLIVQRNGSVVWAELDPALAAQGVIVCSLEQAFERHFDLACSYYERRVGHDEGKFSAANAALWAGGAFVYVPPDVAVSAPIQIVYLIDEPDSAQYGRSLAIFDRGSTGYLREFNIAPEKLGPDGAGQALHCGALELFAEESSRVKLATFQDWGHGQVFDISTKRVEIGRDAHCAWFPIHLGGHLTKQTLDIVTAARGADMRHKGVYFAEGDEHFDLFTTDRHEIGDTTGDTVWKGAVTGAAKASYEGLIEIVHGAQNSHTYLQTHSMMLSPRAKIDAIPSLIVKTDDVSASHGGTIGEIDEQQLFYMASRGIPRHLAIRILVEGFFEPVLALYEDDQLAGAVRERIAAKLTSAAADVDEYVRAK